MVGSSRRREGCRLAARRCSFEPKLEPDCPRPTAAPAPIVASAPTVAAAPSAPIVQAELASDAAREAHRFRTGLIWTAILVVLALAIGLAAPDVRGVLHRLSRAHSAWIAAALVLELASCLGYVATMRLVLKRAPAREVRRLAWAEMAFGAVVPIGGSGSLAVGAWVMRAWGLSWKRIADRSAVIFLLTSAINAAVLTAAGVGFWLLPHGSLSGLVYGLLPAAIAASGLAFFLSLPRGGTRLIPGSRARRLGRLATWVRRTEEVAFTPDWRLLGAIGYLLFDIAVLWASLRAFGETPPILAMALGYQIGYLANLLPIPGGIGVLDGGLLAALVLFGLPVGPTAAAVLVYHAIALWVPTLGGTIGFARLRGTLQAPPELILASPASDSTAPRANELAA